ncbi:MAG TPA: flagellin [Stellaceae bacterium]|jgi:flagellin
MLAGSINTNVSALYALNALANNGNTTSTLEQELSTGLQINSPADNPAGYIAAQGFTAQISGITQAASNANQAISLVQTADGAITQQVNILQNIASIADQAANGGATSQQLSALQQVVSQLQAQVSTISSQTNFNGVNLLDGTFQNINFQVGADAGQTIGLSLTSTAANNIGAYNSSASTTSGPYHTAGASTGAVGDNTGASYAVTSAGTGAFTAGSFGVSGSSGNHSVTVTATESAENVAAAINAVTSSTNVTASATTSVALAVTTTGTFSFTLGNGNGTAGGGSVTNGVTISGTISADTASGLSSLVNQINGTTGQTGIVASVNSANNLVLTQSQGDNIAISGFTGNAVFTSGGTTPIAIGAGSGHDSGVTIQGLVTLQSSQSFGLSSSASDIGLNTGSTLSSLASINVSTTAGASAALNVVQFALQQLETEGSQLGATQQRLQATVNNLQTTQTNLTSARSTVQDANIPQVSTQLTQQQILQQAGVSALAQSAQMQQAFLKLLQ